MENVRFFCVLSRPVVICHLICQGHKGILLDSFLPSLTLRDGHLQMYHLCNLAAQQFASFMMTTNYYLVNCSHPKFCGTINVTRNNFGGGGSCVEIDFVQLFWGFCCKYKWKKWYWRPSWYGKRAILFAVVVVPSHVFICIFISSPLHLHPRYK